MSLKIDNRYRINSIFICIIFFAPIITKIISKYMNIDGLLGFIYLGSIICTILFGKIELKYNIIFFILSIFIIFFINILFCFNSHQYVYLFNLISFGMTGIVASMCKFDLRYVANKSIIINLIWILHCFIDKFNYANQDSFGFGFLMLPVIYFTFIWIVNKYKDKDNKKVFLGCILQILQLSMILSNSGRGAIVNIFVFIMLILFSSNKRKYKFVFYVLLLASILLLINISEVLIFIKYNLRIESYFIEKTLRLMENSNDISNGRLDIYINSISNLNGIQYILGASIGKYAILNQGGYTHNIFLSILWDWGIFGVIFIILGIVNIFKTIKYVDIEKKYYLIMLFCLSIISLSFSGDYWNSVSFWYFISISIKNTLDIDNMFNDIRRIK